MKEPVDELQCHIYTYMCMYVHTYDVHECLHVCMCDCACVHVLILLVLVFFFALIISGLLQAIQKFQSPGRTINLFMLFGCDSNGQMDLPFCSGASGAWSSIAQASLHKESHMCYVSCKYLTEHDYNLSLESSLIFAYNMFLTQFPVTLVLLSIIHFTKEYVALGHPLSLLCKLLGTQISGCSNYSEIQRNTIHMPLH